eukprot:293776-Chlamydomonas_euryale.AAC.1
MVSDPTITLLLHRLENQHVGAVGDSLRNFCGFTYVSCHAHFCYCRGDCRCQGQGPRGRCQA